MSSNGPAAAFADAPPASPRRRTWLIPVVLLILLVVILAAVIVIARQTGSDGTPPRPDAFVPPAAGFPTVPYDVNQRSADGTVTIAASDGATSDVNLDAIPVELLEPIDLSDIDPGERVNLIGRPNEVRNFVVTSIVALGEGPALQEGDSGYRSEAGFQGWEAERDQGLRAILAGTVSEATATSITLDTAAGPTTVRLVAEEDQPPPTVYRISTGGEPSIDSGDRLALAGLENGDPETADAALVQPAN